jgi:hypothetical protein
MSCVCGCSEWIFNKLISRVTHCQSWECQNLFDCFLFDQRKYSIKTAIRKRSHFLTLPSLLLWIYYELRPLRPFLYLGNYVPKRLRRNYLAKEQFSIIYCPLCVSSLLPAGRNSKEENEIFDKKLFKLWVSRIRQKLKNVPKIQYPSFQIWIFIILTLHQEMYAK